MKGGINRIWASLVVEELIRCGVDTFVMASGYRSAPLALAAAAHSGARVISHFDERGAAFVALGSARVTGRAAAWITTSGTAAANGLPAAIEAHADRVPLLLLTADRPPELQATGANQTIRQSALFQPFVRWSFQLPPPSEAVAPTMILTTVDQAVHRMHGQYAGPVHLNCRFRAPLVREAPVNPAYLEPLCQWAQSGKPFTTYVRAPDQSAGTEIAETLDGVSRVLMVIGRLRRPEDGAAALDLAQACRWPVIADIGSQVRLGAASDVRMEAAAQCLEADALDRVPPPQAVLYLGAPAVSKKLRQYLRRHRPPRFVTADESPCRFDPQHEVTQRIQCRVASACAAAKAALSGRTFDEAWLGSWQHVNRRARRAISKEVASSGLISEPAVVRIVSRLIPQAHTLVLGSSMPIRDADRFSSIQGPRVRVVANRGASGIDGTVATAAGAAAASGAPATVVLGDLALLHDLNSLSLARSAPLVIIVINNDGGGIFHMVDIATSPELFEQCFGTPHGLHFADAAHQFELSYARVSTIETLAAVYSEACGRAMSTLIEICTDRSENSAYHAALASRTAAAIK